MKNLFIYIMFFINLIFSCTSNGSGDDSINPVYRQYMREFVQNISSYSKGINTNFLIIPQNGNELLTVDGEVTGLPSTDYINAIDGVGREDLFYGYNFDNVPTPLNVQNYMISFLDIAESNNVEVLTTDYCSTTSYMDDSYTKNSNKNYISFAADQRELNNIPLHPVKPYNENSDDITDLSQAKNFLYIINTDAYASKNDFITEIDNTNYDILLIDLFYYFDSTSDQLTLADITNLKTKANGKMRLVIVYMSIGEAEEYRYYWQPGWHTGNPSWIWGENPDWPGNYKVAYWDPAWQSIIYGNNDSYLKKIIDAGFDGVYLDIIDAFEYFE